MTASQVQLYGIDSLLGESPFFPSAIAPKLGGEGRDGYKNRLHFTWKGIFCWSFALWCFCTTRLVQGLKLCREVWPNDFTVGSTGEAGL